MALWRARADRHGNADSPVFPPWATSLQCNGIGLLASVLLGEIQQIAEEDE